MLISAAVLGLEAVLAFLTLDLVFRAVPLDPNALRGHLRSARALYVTVAALACLAGVAGQWLSGGWGGLGLGTLNWAPWWLLWRFGLRKQFTFLYKADGGHPVNTEKPDP